MQESVGINHEEKLWETVFAIGGIAALLSFGLTLFDIVFGSITSADLTLLPHTAVERFSELKGNAFLGLYRLDLLNVVNSLVMVPVYLALYAAHRSTNRPFALGAFLVFLIGTVVFITTNTSLALLELSRKFYAAGDEAERMLFAAAGEALLVRGEHGSLGVFPGFFLSSAGSVLMSLVLLQGKVFGRVISLFGVVGNSLLLAYLLIMAVLPRLKTVAVALAAPGGILVLIWLLMISIRLLRPGSPNPKQSSVSS